MKEQSIRCFSKQCISQYSKTLLLHTHLISNFAWNIVTMNPHPVTIESNVLDDRLRRSRLPHAKWLVKCVYLIFRRVQVRNWRNVVHVDHRQRNCGTWTFPWLHSPLIVTSKHSSHDVFAAPRRCHVIVVDDGPSVPDAACALTPWAHSQRSEAWWRSWFAALLSLRMLLLLEGHHGGKWKPQIYCCLLANKTYLRACLSENQDVHFFLSFLLVTL